MGTIWIPPNQFAAFFGDRIGFKSGLALTREEIVEHIGKTDPIALAIASMSDEPMALRTDEIVDAFQVLLHRLGCLKQSFVGHGPTLLDFKYQADTDKHNLFTHILSILGSYHFDNGKHALSDGFDKAAFYELIQTSLPGEAFAIAVELVELIELGERASPWDWFPARQVNWQTTLELRDLFASESLSTMYGSFFDQRFINYLSENFAKISAINWRKFEGLAAEFFVRRGYEVDIGPGRNDGGIDIRVWKSNSLTSDPPAILVQCKRQKEKIGKVVVKALWADVIDEFAESGLIVTSSTIAPGADTVRHARAYPIQIADRATLKNWIEELRIPGKGIFLGS